MAVTDRLLPQLPSLLGPKGHFYLVAVKENDPEGIVARMRKAGLAAEVHAAVAASPVLDADAKLDAGRIEASGGPRASACPTHQQNCTGHLRTRLTSGAPLQHDDVSPPSRVLVPSAVPQPADFDISSFFEKLGRG